MNKEAENMLLGVIRETSKKSSEYEREAQEEKQNFEARVEEYRKKVEANTKDLELRLYRQFLESFFVHKRGEEVQIVSSFKFAEYKSVIYHYPYKYLRRTNLVKEYDLAEYLEGKNPEHGVVLLQQGYQLIPVFIERLKFYFENLNITYARNRSEHYGALTSEKYFKRHFELFSADFSVSYETLRTLIHEASLAKEGINIFMGTNTFMNPNSYELLGSVEEDIIAREKMIRRVTERSSENIERFRMEMWKRLCKEYNRSLSSAEKYFNDTYEICIRFVPLEDDKSQMSRYFCKQSYRHFESNGKMFPILVEHINTAINGFDIRCSGKRIGTNDCQISYKAADFKQVLRELAEKAPQRVLGERD